MLRVLFFNSISTICQSAEYILELFIQIQIIQLLIFTEKFSPLREFEPGTSLVPSRFASGNKVEVEKIKFESSLSGTIYLIVSVL